MEAIRAAADGDALPALAPRRRPRRPAESPGRLWRFPVSARVGQNQGADAALPGPAVEGAGTARRLVA